MTKKIAFPTDDGETISRHFGKASFFYVVALDDGGEPTFEKRRTQGHEQHELGQGHGGKFARLADCHVLIGAGMGQPAYDRVQKMGLEVLLTGEKQIEVALAKYQSGELTNDLRRVHAHHHHEHDDDHDHQSQPIRFVDGP